MYMGIKTYQEKNTNPMEKELTQSDIPVRRTIPKTIKKIQYSMKVVFLNGIQLEEMSFWKICTPPHL